MRLYHFIDAKYGLDDLQNSRLKIAEFHDLNDPFELSAADVSDPLQRQIFYGWQNDIKDKWGVLCFSRSWQNPVLWSHYADKYRGICLGFDVADQYMIPIKYATSRIKLNLIELEKNGALNQKLMLRLMTTKFVDWKYEKEVRLSPQLETRDPKTGLFFFEFSDDLRLTEIIAGPLCTLTESNIRSTKCGSDTKVAVFKSGMAFKKFSVVKNKQGFAS